MTLDRIDSVTGEVVSLVPFRAADIERSAQGVVDLLSNARQWLASAVDLTGPAQIALAKAQIVTAETYAKELQLSKEIQMDAAEMVRRAEYSLDRAIRKGQDEGGIARRGDRVANHPDQKISPSSFFAGGQERSDAYQMGELEPEQFESVLTAAKDEGNLSRANVVRKVKGIKDGSVETRDMRAEKIAELAASGHATRQIAPLVGITEETVTRIANDYSIEIPADRYVKNRRRLNSAEVLNKILVSLESDIEFLALINPQEVQGEQIDSLIQSINALRKAANKIKESLS